MSFVLRLVVSVCHGEIERALGHGDVLSDRVVLTVENLGKFFPLCLALRCGENTRTRCRQGDRIRTDRLNLASLGRLCLLHISLNARA